MSVERHLPLMQVAARVHAHRIARSLNLSGYERADVCQDLLVEMLPRFQRYDPGRASAATFIDVLARHAAHAVRIRYRGALRRDLSLDTDPTDGESVSSTAEVAAQELTIHVDRALSTLPPSLRGLLHLLRDGDLSDARRESGLGHATFYRRLREIRLHFLTEGLHPAG